MFIYFSSYFKMGHHINTGFALIATFISVGIGALLMTIGHSRLNDITSNLDIPDLDSAKSLSLWAYIIAWIVAGLTLILSFIYFSHDVGSPLFGSEWPHTIVFILIVGGIIASGILALIAASDAKDVKDKNNLDIDSADTYLYWGAGLMGLALLIVILTGVWRAWHIGTVHEVKAKALTKVDHLRGRHCTHNVRMTADGKRIVDSDCKHSPMVVSPRTQHQTVHKQVGPVRYDVPVRGVETTHVVQQRPVVTSATVPADQLHRHNTGFDGYLGNVDLGNVQLARSSPVLRRV